MQTQRGFTLLELLIALAVLALLAALGTRGLTAVLQAQAQVGSEERRWNDVSAALSQVARDVSLAVARPEAGDESALLVTRLGDSAPAQRGLRRVGYRLREGTVEYLAWAPGRPASATPDAYPLIEHVAALKWRSLDDAGNWSPLATAPAGALPRALEVDMALATGERIVRIFALR